MGKFADYIETLKGVEGDYPGTLIDDLTLAYDEDFAGAGEASAELAAANETIASLNARIATLEEANHALILALPAADIGDDETDEDEDSDEDSDDDSDEASDTDGDAIDRLFA